MSDTPRTDALCTDPAIERRDVPARVWRAMAAMERENGRLRMIVERYLATNGISLPVIDKDARALLAELAGKENLK